MKTQTDDAAVMAAFITQHIGVAKYAGYKRDLLRSGLIEHLRIRRQQIEGMIHATPKHASSGAPYSAAYVPEHLGTALYTFVRHVKPLAMIETGVCNGFGTAYLLQALKDNKAGVLYSIDLPEILNADYPPGYFWSGKRGGAVVEQPGSAIPDALKDRWLLSIGRSSVVLPRVLSELDQPLDMFIHDSEHSPENMRFEYAAAWEYLRPGGWLLSDDINWNSAWDEFAYSVRRVPERIGLVYGVMQK